MKKLAGVADYRRIPSLGVSDNAKILLRYEYMERRLLRITAGWLPGIDRWEAKLLAGRMIWEDAEHANDLRARIMELRTSARAFDRTPDPHLGLLLDEMILADDTAEFLTGLLAIKQLMTAAYREHIQLTQPLVDYPTVRLLERMIADEENHIHELEELLSVIAKPEDKERLNAWVSRLDQLCNAAAGVQGLNPVRYQIKSDELRSSSRSFQYSRAYALDERFASTEIRQYRPEKLEQHSESQYGILRIAHARFFEMQAAKGVALSIFENDQMPWEYYHTSARHLWDEIRHCAMGTALLEDLGIDWTQVPHWIGNYMFYTELTPLERYIRLGIIVELNMMQEGSKKREYEFCRENGFLLAESFQDYDWADEVNHVDYARTWINQMVNHDSELLDEKIQDVQNKFKDFYDR